MGNNVTDRLKDGLLYVEQGTDKKRRTMLVNRSGWFAFLISGILVCLVVPIGNYLNLSDKVFCWQRRMVDRIFFGRHLKKQPCIWLCRVGVWWILGLGLTFFFFNSDIMITVKRLGRIPVALMPALVFLTLRPSPLPHTLYLMLIPVHNFLAYVIVLQSTLHSVVYLCLFWKEGVFFRKLKSVRNMWGVLTLLILILMGVSSSKMVRRSQFRMFYYIHYVGTWLFVLAVYMHSLPKVTIYSMLTVCILLYQIWYRVVNTRSIVMNVVSISPSLAMMEFPLKDLARKPVLPSSHIRICLRSRNIFRRCIFYLVPLQHPFTLASLPSDETVRLIVRKSKFPLEVNSRYYVTGVFESNLDFISKRWEKSSVNSPDLFPLSSSQSPSSLLMMSSSNYLISARKVLIITGGSGISFGLPLLHICNFNGADVRLLWVTRDSRDLRVLDHFKTNFKGLEIYLTSTERDEQDLKIDYVNSENLSSCGRNGSSREVELFPSQPILESTQFDNASINTLNYLKPLVEVSPNTKYNTFSSFRFGTDFGSKNKDEVNSIKLLSERNPTNSTRLDTEVLNLSPEDVSEFREAQSAVTSNIGIPFTIRDDDNSINKIKIPKNVKLYFGRPKLSVLDYQWCIEKDFVGLSSTDNCNPSNSDVVHVEDLALAWVIAAGPPSLVAIARIWAGEYGLRFHEESFSV